MDKKAIEDKVLQCFAMTYKKDVAALSRDTRIVEELSSKSLLMVALVSTVENEFDVLIPLPEASKMKTIGDMVDEVCARIE